MKDRCLNLKESLWNILNISFNAANACLGRWMNLRVKCCVCKLLQSFFFFFLPSSLNGLWKSAKWKQTERLIRRSRFWCSGSNENQMTSTVIHHRQATLPAPSGAITSYWRGSQKVKDAGLREGGTRSFVLIMEGEPLACVFTLDRRRLKTDPVSIDRYNRVDPGAEHRNILSSYLRKLLLLFSRLHWSVWHVYQWRITLWQKYAIQSTQW